MNTPGSHRIASALPFAWLLLLNVTLRWDSALPGSDLPPAFGFPAPWASWGGVSSGEWVVSLPFLSLDLLVYCILVSVVARSLPLAWVPAPLRRLMWWGAAGYGLLQWLAWWLALVVGINSLVWSPFLVRPGVSACAGDCYQSW